MLAIAVTISYIRISKEPVFVLLIRLLVELTDISGLLSQKLFKKIKTITGPFFLDLSIETFECVRNLGTPEVVIVHELKVYLESEFNIDGSPLHLRSYGEIFEYSDDPS